MKDRSPAPAKAKANHRSLSTTAEGEESKFAPHQRTYANESGMGPVNERRENNRNWTSTSGTPEAKPTADAPRSNLNVTPTSRVGTGTTRSKPHGVMPAKLNSGANHESTIIATAAGGATATGGVEVTVKPITKYSIAIVVTHVGRDHRQVVDADQPSHSSGKCAFRPG